MEVRTKKLKKMGRWEVGKLDVNHGWTQIVKTKKNNDVRSEVYDLQLMKCYREYGII